MSVSITAPSLGASAKANEPPGKPVTVAVAPSHVAVNSKEESSSSSVVTSKVDVEGHELMIIKGMEKNLKRNNCLLQVEIFEDNFSKTNKQLENYGFRMLGVTNEKDSYFYSNKS